MPDVILVLKKVHVISAEPVYLEYKKQTVILNAKSLAMILHQEPRVAINVMLQQEVTHVKLVRLLINLTVSLDNVLPLLRVLFAKELMPILFISLVVLNKDAFNVLDHVKVVMVLLTNVSLATIITHLVKMDPTVQLLLFLMILVPPLEANFGSGYLLSS